jgi:hypothetical protein
MEHSMKTIPNYSKLSKEEKAKSLSQGVKDRLSDVRVSHQLRYEEVLNNIAWTRLEKCALYGEKRYEENALDFNLWMCFSDVYRKYIRLEQLTKDVNRLEEGTVAFNNSFNALKDAYLDIANYGINGYQILTNEENKNV